MHKFVIKWIFRSSLYYFTNFITIFVQLILWSVLPLNFRKFLKECKQILIIKSNFYYPLWNSCKDKGIGDQAPILLNSQLGDLPNSISSVLDDNLECWTLIFYISIICIVQMNFVDKNRIYYKIHGQKCKTDGWERT